MGTHDELLAKENGLYRSLVAHQLAATTLEVDGAGGGIVPSASSAMLFDTIASGSGGAAAPVLISVGGGGLGPVPLVGGGDRGAGSGGSGGASPAPMAVAPLILL